MRVSTLRFDFFCLEAAQITYLNDLTPRVTKLRVYRLSRLFDYILRLFAANLAPQPPGIAAPLLFLTLQVLEVPEVGGEDALQDAQLSLLHLLALVAVQYLAHVSLLAVVHVHRPFRLLVDPIQVHVRRHNLPQPMFLSGPAAQHFVVVLVCDLIDHAIVTTFSKI